MQDLAYICRSLQMSPSQSVAFIDAVETLKYASCPSALAVTCVEELTRMPNYVAVFGLSSVLSAQVESSHLEAYIEQVHSFLSGLLSQSNSELASASHDIATLILQRDAFTAITKKFDNLLRRFSTEFATPTNRREPFVAVADYIDQAVFLILLERYGFLFSDEMRRLEDNFKENEAFRNFFEDCLEGRFGRLALTTAIRLVPTLTQIAPRHWIALLDDPLGTEAASAEPKVRDLYRKVNVACLPLELDCLAALAFARLYRADRSKKTIASLAVREASCFEFLLTPAMSLNEYNSYQLKRQLELGIGFVKSQTLVKIAETQQIAFWQSVVWSTSVELAPSECAAEYVELFDPPVLQTPSRDADQNATTPLKGSLRELWESKLQNLYSTVVIGSTPRATGTVTVVHHKDCEPNLSEDLRVITTGFWNAANKDRNRQGFLNLGKFLTRASIALRVQTMPDSPDSVVDKETKTRFAALLVYVENLLGYYKWTRYDEFEKADKESPYVTEGQRVVLIHLKHMIFALVSGTLGKCNVSALCDACAYPNESEDRYWKTRQFKEHQSGTKAFLNWAETSLPFQGLNETAKELLDRTQAFSNFDGLRNSAAELRRRLLCYVACEHDAAAIDWNNSDLQEKTLPSKKTESSGLTFRYRELLVIDGLDTDALTQISRASSSNATLDGAESPNDTEVLQNPSSALALAICTAQALFDGASWEQKESLAKELSSAISLISDRKYADRYLLLKCLQFLKTKMFALPEDLRTDIENFLIEFGNPSVIRSLFEAHFQSIESADPITDTLLIALFSLTKRIRRRAAHLVERAKFRAGALSPFDVVHQKLIPEVANLYAGRALEIAHSLRPEFVAGRPNLIDFTLARTIADDPEIQPVDGFIGQRGRSPGFKLPSNVAFAGRIQVAAAEPHDFGGHVLASMHQFDGALNFLGYSKQDIEKHLSWQALRQEIQDGKHRIIGHVDWRKENSIQVSVGFGKLNFTPSKPVFPGDFLSIKYPLQAGEEPDFQNLGDGTVQEKIVSLRTEFKPIDERTPNAGFVTELVAEPKGRKEEKRTVWLSRFSTNYLNVGNFKAPYQVDLIVRRINEKPMIYGREELQAECGEAVTGVGGERSLQLCLHKFEDGSLLVETTPGRLFNINEDDLDNDLISSLQKKLEEIKGRENDILYGNSQDPAGLVFFVKFICDESGKVKLHKNTFTKGNLFDERNTYWASLQYWLGGEVEVLPPNATQNYYRAELSELNAPAKLPTYVRVKARNSRPQLNQDPIPAVPIRWSPQDGILEVEYERQRTIEPSARTYEGLKRYLGLCEGDHLDMVYGLNRLRKTGEVRARTSLNTYTIVRPETLSMKPATNNELLGRRKRKLIVEHVSAWKVVSGKISMSCFADDFGTDNEYEGVVVTTPAWKREQKSGTISVDWLVDGNLIKRDIDLSSNDGLLLVEVGNRVVMRRQNGEVQYTLERRIVRSSALWEMVEGIDADDAQFYVGRTKYKNQTRSVLEVDEGKLCLVTDTRGVRHIFGSKRDEVKASHMGDSRFFRNFYGARYKRLLLETEDKRSFCGWASDNIDGETIAIKEVHIEIDLVKDCTDKTGPLFNIQRFLDVGRPIKKTISQRRQTQEILDLEQQSFLLEQAIVNGQAFPVETNGESASLTSAQLGLPDAIPVIDQPFLEFQKYSPHGQVVLQGHADTDVHASFRMVKPYSVYQFLHDLIVLDDFADTTASQSGWSHQTITLEDRLYYIGLSGKSTYRFEWGYGKTLEGAADDLLFSGQPFESVELLLFHGDAIREVNVWLDQFAVDLLRKLSEVGDGRDEHSSQDILAELSSHIKLDIVADAVMKSAAHKLYEQSRDFNMVHLMRIVSAQNEPVIQQVLSPDLTGLSDFAIVDNQTFSISMTSALALRDVPGLFVDFEGNERNNVLVYGRMDQKEFLNSGGQSAQFEIITAIPDNIPGLSALQAEDTVLLQLGKIKQIPGDYLVELLLPEKLSAAIYGTRNELKLNLPRRIFSAREDMLERLYKIGTRNTPRSNKGEWPSSKELEGHFVVIKLGENKRAKAKDGLLFASIRKAFGDSRIPYRSSRALKSYIRQSEDRTYVTVSDARELIFEIAPGRFVKLSVNDIARQPEHGLLNMDILAVEVNKSGRFVFRTAQFSDRKFVRDTPRPAVLLPKTPLLKDAVQEEESQDTEFWNKSKKTGVTIAGLPGIEAVPSTMRLTGGSDGEETLAPTDFHNWMTRENYKPGYVRQNRNLFYYSPELPPEIGQIETKGDEICQFRPMRSNGVVEEIPWENTSFRDAHRPELNKDLDLDWRPHDKQTGHWSSEGKVSIYKTKCMSARNGPICAQKTNAQDYPTLRYHRDDWWKYTHSLRYLIEFLHSCNKRTGQVIVVGHDGPNDLVVQLSPGRLVQVALARFHIRMGDGFIAPRLLPSVFAMGDELTLRVISEDKYSVENFEIVNWLSGLRSNLGQKSALLRIVKAAPTVIGSGRYTMKLPHTLPDDLKIGQMVWLTDKNVLTPASKPAFDLRNRAVVFLKSTMHSDSKVKVRIDGFDDLNLMPDDGTDISWKIDAISQCVRNDSNSNRRLLNYPELHALIQANGGTLPVTICGVTKSETKTVFFDRSAQCPDGVASTDWHGLWRYVGVVENRRGTFALMSCGGLLRAVRPDHAIQGLPDLPANAIRKIFESIDEVDGAFNAIWSKTDGLSFGGRMTESAEFPATFIQHHSETVVKGVPPQEILIFKSGETGKYCCVRTTKAAWTSIAASEFAECAEAWNQDYKIRKLTSSKSRRVSFSLIDSAIAQNEIRSLTPGDVIPVKRIKTASLAVSMRTGLSVQIEDSACKLQSRHELPAEIYVVERGANMSITVCPVGDRPHILNIPQNLLIYDVAKSGAQPSTFSTFVAIRKSRASYEEVECDLDPMVKSCLTIFGSEGTEPKKEEISDFLNEIQSVRESCTYTLHSAIVTILTLDRLSQLLKKRNEDDFAIKIKFQMSDFTQELVLRAAHSRHIEVLLKMWLRNSDVRYRKSTPLWRRLQPLAKLLGTNQVDRDSFQMLESFVSAANFSQIPDMRPIVDALEITLGWPNRMRSLHQYGGITGKIVDMGLTLFPALGPMQKKHINRLEEILDELIDQEFDMPLLDLREVHSVFPTPIEEDNEFNSQ